VAQEILMLLVAGGLAIIAMLIALRLALWVITVVATGAGVLFGYAGEQGFVGVAAFIACWVFMFTVMVVLAAIIGLVNQPAH